MQGNEQEKSPIKGRISQYLEIKGITKYAFYRDSGITRGILDQDTGISEDNMARFLAYAKDISPLWLVSGEGGIFKTKSIEKAVKDDDGRNDGPNDGKPKVQKRPSNTETKIVPFPKDNQTRVAEAHQSEEGIPLIPLDAVAGFCNGDPVVQVMGYECEKFVVPGFRDADFLIPVKGDSMEPKYLSGDVVACKCLSLDTFFQWNRAYVVDSEQGVLIKRVKKGPDDDHVTMVSENEHYDPFVLHRSEIHALALVIGVIRME